MGSQTISNPGYPSPPPPIDATDKVNAIILPTFALLAIMIMYLPFRSFLRTRNFPAGNLVVITTVSNLIIFVNAILWPNGNWTKWYKGTGYCDVLAYIKFPLTTAISTSLLALSRALLNALDVDKHNFADTPALRRRILITHFLICWTIPLIQICMYYFIQQSRYGIMPVYGCTVMPDQSWFQVLVLYPWAPIASLIAAFQSAMIIYRLRKLNQSLSTALSSGHSSFTARRYLKLLILSIIMVIVFIPVQSFCFYVNLPPGVTSYSFSRTHDPVAWHWITYFETAGWPVFQYYGWLYITMSAMIFLFFGLSDEAIDSCRKGLVVMGFGKIWPNLKESRETRRLRTISLDQRSTRSSLVENLDIVGRAVKYFDNSNTRKNSQSTTMVGSECQSRKGSQATFNTLALATLTSNVLSNGNKPDFSAGEPSGLHPMLDADAITATPLDLEQDVEKTLIQEPEPVANPPPNRGFLTIWRTHLHLPFPLFSTPSTNKGKDVEAQPTSEKSTPSHITNPPTTVSTTIWGQPFAQADSSVKTTTKTQTSQLSASTLHSIDESVDPLSPKLGSRAYRERERREMERERKEAREAALAKKIAVQAELGGVVVKTISLDVREEGGFSSSQ